MCYFINSNLLPRIYFITARNDSMSHRPNSLPLCQWQGIHSTMPANGSNFTGVLNTVIQRSIVRLVVVPGNTVNNLGTSWDHFNSAGFVGLSECDVRASLIRHWRPCKQISSCLHERLRVVLTVRRWCRYSVCHVLQLCPDVHCSHRRPTWPCPSCLITLWALHLNKSPVWLEFYCHGVPNNLRAVEINFSDRQQASAVSSVICDREQHNLKKTKNV